MKTVSLELSKALKEAGYPQRIAPMYWSNYQMDKIGESDDYYHSGRVSKDSYEKRENDEIELMESTNAWIFSRAIDQHKITDAIFIASPSADEILDILPCRIWKNGIHYDLTLFKGDKYWHEDGRSDDKIDYALSYEAYKEGVTDTLDIGTYDGHASSDDSLSDAAAKMWLYLKKEDLL